MLFTGPNNYRGCSIELAFPRVAWFGKMKNGNSCMMIMMMAKSKKNPYEKRENAADSAVGL